MPNWKKVIVSGSDAALNSLNVTNGITGSLLGTASYSTYAENAGNGGVTQITAGSNVVISPTNGKGNVTISSTGGSNYNTATGSYGSFYDTGSYTIASTTTIYSMSFSNTSITNGVYTSGSDKTKIYFTNPGIYNLAFSAQFENSATDNADVNIWFRQGNDGGSSTNIADSDSQVTVPPKKGTSNGKVIAAWNIFVSVVSNDYIQLAYAGDTSISLVTFPESLVTPIHPLVPCVIATANRVDTFLSNTGSFSGSFNGVLTGTASYAAQALSSSYATTASYWSGSILNATSASYASTASYVLNAISSSYATKALSASYAPPSSVFPYTGTANIIGSLDVVGPTTLNTTGNTFTLEAQNNDAGSGWVTRFSRPNIANGEFSGILIGAGAYREGFIQYFDNTTPSLIHYGFGIGGDSAAGVAIYKGGRLIINDASTDPTDDGSGNNLQVNGNTSLHGTANIDSNVSITGSLNVVGGITGSLLGTASYASQAGNTAAINVSVFGSDVDSYLLMSNVAGTTGVGIGGDADLRYNASTNKLTVGNISATSLTGSLLGTASYATQALSASYAPPSSVFPYTGSALITGSLGVTGSISTTSTLNVGGVTTLTGAVTASGIILANNYINISRGTDAYVTNLNVNSGTANTSVFQINTDQPNSKSVLNSRNSYAMSFYTNDVERALLSTSLFQIKVPTTITGSTIITGSLETTGSVKFLVTGSDLVNIGNASTTGQRLLRIGQGTATIDIGNAAAYPGMALIHLNTATPSANNYALMHDGSSTYLNSINSNPLYLCFNNNIQQTLGSGFITFAPIVRTSAAITPFTFTVPANTGQTAGSNIPNVKILNGNKQWATGNIPSQYWVHITAPTASAVGASFMTGSHTLFVERASAGPNMSIVGNYAAGFSGSVQILLGGIDVTGSASISGSLNVTGGITGSLTGSVNGAVVNNTAWTSYTPAWTAQVSNPSIGNGTITGAYKQIGKTVFVRVKVSMGSSTTYGSGAWLFGLPVTASSADGIQFPCSMLDNGVAWYEGTVNGTYEGSTFKTAIISSRTDPPFFSIGVDANAPFVWGDGDSLQFNGSYESI